MDYLIVCTVALVVSGLTLFSGFGLGTLLMPAFALFFPLPVAIGATAVVHLANNLFKLILIGREADSRAVLLFGLPAAASALVGAILLTYFARLEPWTSYSLGGLSCTLRPEGIVIGVLIVVFALFDLVPALARISFDRKYLPLGGLLSGFFGGLSGHQGALRSAFLLKSGLSKEAFVGTNVVCAVIVDLVRLLIYGVVFYSTRFADVWDAGPLLVAATLAAFAGAFLGRKLLNKITLRTVQWIVGIMLVLVGVALAAGLI